MSRRGTPRVVLWSCAEAAAGTSWCLLDEDTRKSSDSLVGQPLPLAGSHLRSSRMAPCLSNGRLPSLVDASELRDVEISLAVVSCTTQGWRPRGLLRMRRSLALPPPLPHASRAAVVLPIARGAPRHEHP